MKKRILTLLLVVMLCTSSMTACGDQETATVSEPSSEFSSAEETSDETAPGEEYDSLEARKLVDDGLGEKDLGGAEFRMLYQERYAEFQYAEELTGGHIE